MSIVWVFDFVITLIIVGYILGGLYFGVIRCTGTIVGTIVGTVATFFAIPLIAPLISSPLWRLAALVAVAVVLIGGGHAVGESIGRAVSSRVALTDLRIVDRLLGAVVNGIATALIATMLSFSFGALGVPVISQIIGTSTVLRGVKALTPDPLRSFMASVRGILVHDAVPQVFDSLAGDSGKSMVPDVNTNTTVLREAALSVVRITGSAYRCGQNQSGSGFVVARNRIVTNAHVVAGVTEPVIETVDGDIVTGRVVYFDSEHDIAMIAVTGLTEKSLSLAATLPEGSSAVVDGYPYGGPFQSESAKVMAVQDTTSRDIYGGAANPREVYTLAASVRAGGSGGPLLAETGDVTGIIFARSASSPNIGYAMTMTELEPVASQASTYSATVSSGDCIPG